MKKLIPILSFVAALLLAVSCDPKEPVVQDSFSVSPTSLEFKAEDSSTQYVTVTASGDWTATASPSWIHVKPTSGTGKGSVSVTVDANKEGGNRTGSISFSGSGTASVSVAQKGTNITPLVAKPDAFDGKKLASTTYQLLIYSFADSDGDGVGDFKGIEKRLDYLDGLGVTGLWLSPAHPADSYHGYDVRDYFALNPQYGSEQDFKDLIAAAHKKGIKIYMDYVLNHSGKGHPWFKEALMNPLSPYRDYYFFSTKPSSEYSSFPMLKGSTYQAGEWQQATSGSPRLTITKTDEAVTTGTSDWNLYTWGGGSSSARELRFKDRGDGSMYLVLDINGECGLLLRQYMNWEAGSKFGAPGDGALTEGTPKDLIWDGGDIAFSGSGRYKVEISNLSTKTVYFMGAFGNWMPDLNYGEISQVEDNACFQDLAASADKWIGMGIDGFRLDAVKHICGGIGSYNNTANQTFLQKWYDHCNATYQAAGHSDHIFMVGEVWDGHENEKKYYSGLTSCFEFGYWPLLYKVLTSQNASGYVSTVCGFIKDHSEIRPDAETSLFMTNHDHASQTGDGEVRAADDLGRDLAKEKQAAAMILTTSGRPFIYQGEELGYWGNSKGKGDEYLRAPIVWDAAAKEVAKKGVNDKVDNDMLKGSISVASQSADAGSLLNVYVTWSRLRNTYPALADGSMTDAGIGGASIVSWYMTSGSQKLLVIHNVSGKEQTVSVQDDTSHPVAVLGTVGLDDKDLVFGGNSSVVFKL